MKLLKFIGLMAIFLSPITANAHTGVVSTSPSQDQVVTQLPSQITIEFSDDLMKLGDKVVNTLTITAPDNSKVKISSISVQKNVITANIPTTEYMDGTYLLSYRVVSGDGHPVSGEYSFVLNAPSAPEAKPIADDQHHSFLHIHQTHLIQGGFLLMLIALWWGYRRFNREQGE